MWEVWAYDDAGELGVITRGHSARSSALEMCLAYSTYYDKFFLVSPRGEVEEVSNDEVRSLVIPNNFSVM